MKYKKIIIWGPVTAAYFLSKTVNKASVKGKEAQIHNNLTPCCGFNEEMNRLKEIIKKPSSAILFLNLFIYWFI